MKQQIYRAKSKRKGKKEKRKEKESDEKRDQEQIDPRKNVRLEKCTSERGREKFKK